MIARRSAPDAHTGHWFVQKRFGYGAVPVTWQGWLSTAAYLAIVGLLGWLMPTGALKLAAIVPVSLVYIYFIWTRTAGGFRWRWGPDEE